MAHYNTDFSAQYYVHYTVQLQALFTNQYYKVVYHPQSRHSALSANGWTTAWQETGWKEFFLEYVLLASNNLEPGVSDARLTHKNNVSQILCHF
jgi:hypothetical protein